MDGPSSKRVEEVLFKYTYLIYIFGTRLGPEIFTQISLILSVSLNDRYTTLAPFFLRDKKKGARGLNSKTLMILVPYRIDPIFEIIPREVTGLRCLTAKVYVIFYPVSCFLNPSGQFCDHKTGSLNKYLVTSIKSWSCPKNPGSGTNLIGNKIVDQMKTKIKLCELLLSDLSNWFDRINSQSFVKYQIFV
ncbi:hypothetical protein BpHYR1_020152 [Brachionus plicatilis]|uniref:Uncharacterized protein n=1 Tax=Brachionus plicatilis TaxID=10195 RepID=A0A3M7PYJ1_BRAPC|nr:hypothetical protein BpHYR1_020152 [Brachionus plicatilis]